MVTVARSSSAPAVAPREPYERGGWTVARALLSADEAAHYRAELQRISGLGDADWRQRWQATDVAQYPAFWPLIFDERILAEVRALLGPDIAFTQHSDLHVHRTARRWHRDSRDRVFGQGSDWDERLGAYRVVRVGIYLQTFAESGFSLGLLPGSHREEHRLNRLERVVSKVRYEAARAVRRRLDPEAPDVPGWWSRTEPRRRGFNRRTRPTWVKTEPGDVLFFDTRLVHMSSPVRGPKYAVFLTYGVRNEHSRNHRRWYLETRTDLDYAELDQELVRRLKDAGLYLGLG